MVEVIVWVLALSLLGLAAQVYGTDSRPAEPERRRL
jgi:hypothetical protein